MKIKICGLFREADIDYVNEARPDFIGFVFAQSRRQVSPVLASSLRQKLMEGIVPVGVFVNAPPESISALYRDGVIDIAQLHGTEDEEYIAQLKKLCGIPVIKTIILDEQDVSVHCSLFTAHCSPDYYLIDSGAGSGKAFNWDLLDQQRLTKPWFLAGGISSENMGEAMKLNPFAIDISSGAETEGLKDREKIMQLTAMAKKGSVL